MSTISATPSPSVTGSEARIPVLTVIESLEQRALSGASFETMTAEVLKAFVFVSDALYGALWRMDRDRNTLIIACEQMPHVSEPAARGWGRPLGELAASALQQSGVRYRAVSEPADRLMTGQGYVALAIPLRGAPAVGGCVTVIVRQGSAITADAGVALLRLLGAFPLLHAAICNAGHFESSYKSLSAAWTLVGEMLVFTHPSDQAQVAVNRARGAFHADRVTMGFIDRDKVTIAAISGEDVIDKRSNAVQLLHAAQMEVVLSGEPGEFSESAQGEERLAQSSRNPQHERLARSRSVRNVLSLPLRREKEIVAVWTFEFGEHAFEEKDRQVMEVAAGQIGPMLHLARQNSRNPLRRGRDLADAAVKWTFGKEHAWRRAVVALGVALLLFAVVGRWTFKVSGNCVLDPSFRRVYGAPFDTTLKSAPVRPGDTVLPGQVIVEFDRDDVEVQLREARSKRTSAEKEMLTYLTEQKVPQYAESKARHDALVAQVELLEKHLARTIVQADFAGMIVSGDLKQDIGRTVRMGQELIELAPLTELVLKVEVEQDDVVYVREGLRGEFTTKARPGVALPFTVTRVHPVAEVHKGESVYIVEATVPNADGWLRPGMEGAAKISIDRRNVTWVAMRKIFNWLRLKIWW